MMMFSESREQLLSRVVQEKPLNSGERGGERWASWMLCPVGDDPAGLELSSSCAVGTWSLLLLPLPKQNLKRET